MANLDGTLNGLIRLAIAGAVAAGAALCVFVVVNQMALDRDDIGFHYCHVGIRPGPHRASLSTENRAEDKRCP